MPTEEENLQYLYLVLTAGGVPNIDFTAISKTLNLSNGATSKRWSRLKQAMEAGKNPGPSAYEFLWLCVKHSTRDKAMDWAEIAAKCGTTSGAASKRYSRMKQAFDRGDEKPATPAKGKNTSTDANGTTTTPGSGQKRKRAAATPKKQPAIGAQDRFRPEDKDPEDDDELIDRKPKRVSKPRATAKSKTKKEDVVVKEKQHDSSLNPTEATTFIKADPDADGMAEPLYSAPVDEGDDTFFDAKETFGGEDEYQQERLLGWLHADEV